MTMDKSLAELKDQGNQHFKVGDFKLAEKFYSDALDKADKKQDKLIFYKNRAACHLKLVSWFCIIKKNKVYENYIHLKLINTIKCCIYLQALLLNNFQKNFNFTLV